MDDHETGSPQNHSEQEFTPLFKRKLKNLLLSPQLQTTLGIYSIILSFIFAGSVIGIIYYNFSDLIRSILVLTDAPDEVRDIMRSYWMESQLYVYFACGMYVLLMVTLTVWYTHRLIGPSIAFKRHILSLAEGKYKSRTSLRKGDAFEEVAQALNLLSKTLEEQKTDPE